MTKCYNTRMNTMNNEKYRASLALVEVALAELHRACGIIEDAKSIMVDAKRELPINDNGALLKVRHDMAVEQFSDLLQTFARTETHIRHVLMQTADKVQRSKEVAQ